MVVEVRSRLTLLVAVFVSAGGAISVACGGDEPAASLSPIGQAPEPLFRALEDDLVASCGGTNGRCHVDGSYQGAPKWLGGPDPYVSIRSYRGILPATREVGDSILLTQVRHAGPSLTEAPRDLYRRVADWLVAEMPPPPLPNTGAFVVQDGFNSVPLDTAGPGVRGGRITFLATSRNGVLSLSAVKLVAPVDTNVKVDSPFFVILPRSGKVSADPVVNGWKGEVTAPAGQSVELFDGKMILLGWDDAGRLKIAFQKLETTPGQGQLQRCAALDAFERDALPAMRATVETLADDDSVDPPPGTVIGPGSCLGCHAKEPDPSQAPSPAVQAMDLRSADADPAAACAQARNWINLGDPSSSTLLLNPTGKGNPQHPMTPLPETDPIVQGLRKWIDAEAAAQR